MVTFNPGVRHTTAHVKLHYIVVKLWYRMLSSKVVGFELLIERSGFRPQHCHAATVEQGP